MFNKKLKNKIKKLEYRISLLEEENKTLIDLVEISKSTLESTNKTIDAYTLTHKSLERNCAILTEMIFEADDTLNELFKITSRYHPMIIKGIATRNDIKTCSNIVQRSLVSYKKFDKLKTLYNKVYNKQVSDLNLDDIQKIKI
jgi:hypothetical protein